MKVFDLSFRYKIPIWGSVLVIVTALAVSATLMAQTYREMEEDLIIDTATLAEALVPSVFTAMLRDDVWGAYELVSKVLNRTDRSVDLPDKAENILVIDNSVRVFAAAHPQIARLGAPLESLGQEFAAIAERLRAAPSDRAEVINLSDSLHLIFMAPIAEEGGRLGTLVVVLTKGSFLPRFVEIAHYGILAGAAVLCVLLPLNWYWGWRMARPLAVMTERMREIGTSMAKPLDASLYEHEDEIGSLFQTYNRMLAEMREKSELEREVVRKERLAALGQLAAGVAHEINNPLGGMLMAIDTLKSQGLDHSHTAKTMALLERGLDQIRETVGALLVEARLNKSRDLSEKDIEDVLVLVLPQVHQKALRLDWRNDLASEVSLPASLIRQVLINLLLNAIHAAERNGDVGCHVAVDTTALRISVVNGGTVLSEQQMTHLFEPFSSESTEGHGLGLWVSYQIVHQLGGRIGATTEGGRTRFSVELPLGEKSP